jgi:hypothetical protein
MLDRIDIEKDTNKDPKANDKIWCEDADGGERRSRSVGSATAHGRDTMGGKKGRHDETRDWGRKGG